MKVTRRTWTINVAPTLWLLVLPLLPRRLLTRLRSPNGLAIPLGGRRFIIIELDETEK